MIQNRQDFLSFVDADRKNNSFNSRHSLVIKYLFLLRKCEYHKNLRHRFRFLFNYYRFKKMSQKYLTFIPLNVCDSGLSISHMGCIFINSHSIIGKNCRISQGVTIGSTNGNNESPKIGDNVFVGCNCSIIGDIEIANDICIGAGSVVVRSCLEPGITIGGNPAHFLSNNNSHKNLKVFANE